jgi:gamma-glutamyltranspeptidase
LFCEGSLGGLYQANLVNEQLIGELKKRGHNVKVSGSLAVAQGIQRRKDAGELEAACDPRSGGRAAMVEK